MELTNETEDGVFTLKIAARAADEAQITDTSLLQLQGLLLEALEAVRQIVEEHTRNSAGDTPNAKSLFH